MKKFLWIILVCVLSIINLGDMQRKSIVMVIPNVQDSLSYDRAKLVLLSVAKEDTAKFLVSTQWEKVRVFDLKGSEAKESFVRDFYGLFEPKVTLQSLVYSFKWFKGYAKPESLTFAYTDTMSVRGFWKRPEFTKFVKEVQKSSEISEVLVILRGWSDSTYSTSYEDPNSDGRALYKLQFPLLPGVNTIYFAAGGDKTAAIPYTTSLTVESKPTTDRKNLFHNSTLEQSCTTCHEGLPSADSGKSMKADCNICHKSMSTDASYLHAPAEMKECASCHSWSMEKRAVVVEKGVPTVCYDCHSEKQAQVDSSAFPHPVASDCANCHSPHGSEQNHIVKVDIYSLCTSCHEDQKFNHPVGRHPVRFTKLANGDEISCTTCHNPHGSPNEHLLRFQGGRMEACNACH